jgi:SpoVK/Ycf46/Vps4 family AAA+-type ATPase
MRPIFREAQHSDAILFFDEADALFGRPSEVKDANDHFANIETAYLLQQMNEAFVRCGKLTKLDEEAKGGQRLPR